MCSMELWFPLHRIFMISSSIITLVAFITTFATRGGWSKSAGAHAICGVILFALVLLNPMMAMLRPPNKSGIKNAEILEQIGKNIS